MKTRHRYFCPSTVAGIALMLFASAGQGANSQLVSWNNLGMHCMDSDYSVFSVLPPYNTIEAQLIVAGRLVTNGAGYAVTYQAIADPDGSFNSTAMGKGNFYDFVTPLFGAGLPPETGLAGWAMPGPNNTPQSMLFEPTNQPAPGVAAPVNWFRAEGIPIAPFDDAGRKNPYPMMRLIARDASNQPMATNDVVLPVSDEMDCRACHASGTGPAAEPSDGWVWSDNPERDYRLNILRLHDERQFALNDGLYRSALAAGSFNAQGLYPGVVVDGKPVLCAGCHASEALGTGSYSNIPPLTASVHLRHASVTDPDLLITLDSSAHRAACYRCHPGSTTKCLRGAMGGAVAPDGTLEMQCQSCHGSMSQVGALNRVGWFMEPNCQSCHTGTATSNNGQIRYTSVFTDTNGTVRVPVNSTFATRPNTPAPGISLFRFSAGHGGLQCEACHGSTHAEFPATHRNDNLRNIALQGHAGVMVECTACHLTSPVTVAGGPHGMHPVGQAWVDAHPDTVESSGATQCRACHGTDYRGTVLSRMQANRTLTAFGTRSWWRGFRVGCYNCHNGPGSETANPNSPALVGNLSTNTACPTPVAMTLPGSDADGDLLVFRVVSQPQHGAVGMSGAVATYFPDAGFVGTDTFTFAAWDGSSDSNLGTVTVTVTQGLFGVTAKALVPPNYEAVQAVPFGVVATPVNLSATPTYEWDFGDGSAPATNRYATHAYATPGTYTWSVISRVQSGMTQAATTNRGAIVITGFAPLAAALSGSDVCLSWPLAAGAVQLEQSLSLGPDARWFPCTNAVWTNHAALSVTVTNCERASFFRLRKR
jgi:hypothetical protein